MNTDARLSILKQLFMTFPNTAVGPETIAMYMRLTADIPDDELQTSIDTAIANSKFLPTIAEIREAWLNVIAPDARPWTEAWEEVMQQMRRVGSYGKPTFSDELTERVVKMFGWRTLCASENPAIDMAHFRDAYEPLAKRQHETARLLPSTKAMMLKSNAVFRLTGD